MGNIPLQHDIVVYLCYGSHIFGNDIHLKHDSLLYFRYGCIVFLLNMIFWYIFCDKIFIWTGLCLTKYQAGAT